MTPTQLKELGEIETSLITLSKQIESLGIELDPEQSSHPIWEIWQPVSAAGARAIRLFNETVQKPAAAYLEGKR